MTTAARPRPGATLTRGAPGLATHAHRVTFRTLAHAGLTAGGRASNNGSMIQNVPRFSFALDPLIAEARRRARQRRAVLVALLAAGIGTALAVTLLPGSGGGGTSAPNAHGGQAQSVQQIRTAFTAHGMKLTRSFWPGPRGWVLLASGNVWVEVRLANADRTKFPGFPTNPRGMQFTEQGNLWVSFPSGERSQVAAALASLR